MAIFNVLEYGVKGDGKSIDTDFIQAGIDKCFQNGGGTVHFPFGTVSSVSFKAKLFYLKKPRKTLEY